MKSEIIIALISGCFAFAIGVLAYIKDIRLKKMEIENKEMRTQLSDISLDDSTTVNVKINILDKLANFLVFNQIKSSVDRMFEYTKADRFIILFAVNGKRDFKIVSVVYEQHKYQKYKINAIVRYRDVRIDDETRNILKEAERMDEVDLKTEDMKNQILKDFYTIEQVKYTKLKFLNRKHLDSENDLVIFATISTHTDEPFNNLEAAVIKTEFEGTISHIINEYI